MAGAIATTQNGRLTIDFTGAASTDGGGIAAIANPEGQTLLILSTTLYVSANSTGAANLSAGIAADATTSATDIINALAMAAAEGKAYNGHAPQATAKTEITAPALWTASKYLTLTGSASTAGLAGKLMVEYVRVTE